MIENVCKNCNAPLDMAEAKNGVVTCAFCGSVFTLPKKDASDKVRKHLDAGETALDQCRFDDALASYTKAIEADGSEPEGYWGRALARNRVQYLRDTVNNRLQPICHEAAADPFTADPDYKRALTLATPEQKAEYAKKAEEIDYIRRTFYAFGSEGLTYDCFICVKVTDENGNPTRDSLDATRIYMELQRAGYKPFFSEYEMGGRTGADYEALILYALHKAPCMLIVCSDAKYLETKWVRNEFTRFYAMLADEEKERDSITIAYKGKVVERLPGVKGRIQGVDLTNLTAMDRIRAFIDSHDAEKRAAAETESAEAIRRAEAKKAEEARRAADEAAAKAQALEERLKKLEQRETERNRPSPAAPESAPKSSAPQAAPRPAAAPQATPAPQSAAVPHRAKPAPAVRVYPAEFALNGTTLDRYTGSAEAVVIPDGVTAIAHDAFADNRRITKVTIPWTVTEIGNSAFSGCSSLQAVTIPPSVKEIGDFAFDKCRSLTSVVLADGLQFIGQYAFSSCASLRSITVPASVRTVEREAFYDSNALTVRCVAHSKPAAWADRWNGDCPVTWGVPAPAPLAKPAPAPVRYKAPAGFTIENTALVRYTGTDANVAVPTWITEIREDAFRDCKALLSVAIPPSVAKIERNAFAGCDGLKAVYIDDLAAWCRMYFRNLSSNPTAVAGTLIVGDAPLTELTVPAGAEIVEYAAFYNVKSLTKVTISRQVKKIGKYAFAGCDNLASITVASDNLTYRAEGNCIIEKKSDTIIAGCNASVIPAHPPAKDSLSPRQIKSIAAGAFYRCSRLQTADIPEGVTEIGDYAFSYCAALASVTLPLSLKKIGMHAFSRCRSLKVLYIPKTVETIGEYAFADCPSLALACGAKSRPDGWDAVGFSGGVMWGVPHPDKKIAAEQSGLVIKDGVLDLYTGDGGDVTIPDGVTKIAGRNVNRLDYNAPKGAFHNCTTLTAVAIPAGVTEIGDYAFCNCSALGKASIPDSATAIGKYAFNNCGNLAGLTLPRDLTSIGARAFDGCTTISSLAVPAGVTEIGEGAFYCCNALETVSLPAGIAVAEESLFEHCVSLKKITLPAGIAEIKQRAFKDCGSLAEIVIPDSVTTIGARAFEGCAALKKIVIPDGVTAIGESAFEGCTSLVSVKFGKSVGRIGESAFKGCAALKAVALPDAVTELCESVFEECAALGSVAFGKSVSRIGEAAFRGAGLVSLTVPDTVTEIGDEAFADCAALKQLFLTEKVNAGWDETIGCTGHSVFARCTALTEVSLPMRQVPDSLFADCTALKTVLFEKGVEETWNAVFAGCTALENVIFSDTVRKIGDGTFMGCTALREIDLPDSVTEIGFIDPYGVFQGCTALERVRLSANLETVGRCTFEGCTALKEMALPDAVRWIHWEAFSGCTALRRVSIPGTVAEIEPGAFDDCPNLTVEIRRKKPLLFPGKWYKGMKKCRLEWKG